MENKDYKNYLEFLELEDNQESLILFYRQTQQLEKLREIYRSLGREARGCTAEFYPLKVTVEDFMDHIAFYKDAFIENMNHLKLDKQWPEDWIQTLGAWCDMEKGNLID